MLKQGLELLDREPHHAHSETTAERIIWQAFIQHVHAVILDNHELFSCELPSLTSALRTASSVSKARCRPV